MHPHFILCCISVIAVTSAEKSPLTLSTQWQTLLLTLQQNPSLVQQLRNNPTLFRNLQNGLAKPTSSPSDQCHMLKKQNERLKQIIQAFMEDNYHYPISSGDDYDLLNQALERRQRELNTAQLLLNQAARTNSVSTSVQRILVTPTPTWSTIVETSSYATLVTRPVSTEVPIILRGSKVITTIVESSTFQGENCIRYNFLYVRII
jgi:hypothetical protein